MKAFPFFIHSCICLFLFLFLNESKAQDQYYEKAEIKLSNGEKLNGFINRVSEKELSLGVEFKTILNKEEKGTFYSSSDINSFSFASDEQHFYQVPYTLLNEKRQKVEALRMAKILVSGKTGLYFIYPQDEEIKRTRELNKKNAKIYFFNKDDQWHQLEVTETLLEPTQMVTNERYKKVLAVVMNDCQSIESDIQNTPFKDEALINLVQKYNTCIAPNQENKIYAFKTKAIIKHGVQAYFTK